MGRAVHVTYREGAQVKMAGNFSETVETASKNGEIVTLSTQWNTIFNDRRNKTEPTT